MKHKILFILLIAGLVATKAILAGRTDSTDAQKHLKPFDCPTDKTVEGEILIQLRTDELDTHKLLRLNESKQFEVATFTKAGDQVIEQQNLPLQTLQREFDQNKMNVTEVTPIQAMFKNGSNNGKSPENATGIYQEVKSPITKISFKQIQTTSKTKEEVLAYPTKTVTKDFIKQLKKSLNQETKFVSEVCNNVEPTSAPPMPDDPEYTLQWGLFNFGVQGGIPDVDVNYTLAWQKLYPIWQLYPANEIVMGIIGAGLDDRPGPSLQNPDLQNVVGGSYVVPAIGGGNYYDYLGSVHELNVTGIAFSGNNDGWGMTGIIKGKIFLSVFNDGSPLLPNADLIDALDQASLNSEIINASYMVIGNDPAFFNALVTIETRGDVVVFGAGNDGIDLDNPGAYNGGYPCRWNGLISNIICVAGIGWDGTRASFGGTESSNYGNTKVDIAAPAKDVWTTFDGSNSYVSGTSLAAPFISGLMSLVKWYRPSSSPNQIKDLVVDPANRRVAPAPQTLRVATRGIPDFLKILQAAARRVPCGDADASGDANVLDALLVARTDVGLAQVRDRIAADFNGDGRVSVMDALLISRYVAGLTVAMACPGI